MAMLRGMLKFVPSERLCIGDALESSLFSAPVADLEPGEPPPPLFTDVRQGSRFSLSFCLSFR